MNNFSPVNGWLHFTNQPKQSPDIKNKRRFDLSYQNAIEEDLGHGFKRYTWRPGVQINSHEYLDFRLVVRDYENVITAGYLTNPMEHIFSLQNGPKEPNVMVLILHNASNAASEVSLWLVVKG
ncbi:hypothetical protein ACIFOT_27310 [Neobacillus sp. NRS-1170]|uniref:hypothetical protein n=1 Tax=Neobacillus sp. NRS-1170 TaxID=3233898 RepID=UPI003D2CFF38